MNTDHLIARLARDAEPVETLVRPWSRASAWTAAACAYVTVLVVVTSPWEALRHAFSDRSILAEQGLAFLTALTAAAAAFATVVPGYRRAIVVLPALCFAAWTASVAWSAEDGSLLGQTDWKCAVTILVSAAIPAVLLTRGITRGAPLMPSVTALLTGLASAAAGSYAVSAFRPAESSTVVLTWHCGTVLLVAMAAALAGRHLLKWPRSPVAGGFRRTPAGE